MSNNDVLLQNLRDFTVQIRHATMDTIVGTGIVVSTDGKIVTCAHVVLAAGVNPRSGKYIPGSWNLVVESIFGRRSEPLTDSGDGEVGVYFPARSGRVGEARRARIVASFSQYEDDVVVLQLVGGQPPLNPEQIARFGIAEPSEGNPFRSYGYAPAGGQKARRAGGTIMGTVERSPDSNLQADLVQLDSDQIDRGMSGAAVLDEERNLVVGLVVERYNPGKNPVKEIDYAVDTYVLTLDPFDLPVQDAPLPLRAGPQPKTDIGEAQAATASTPGIVLNGAPPPLDEWVGREDLLAATSADWTNPKRRVTGLIGFGGEGKSSLARRWLDMLLADSSPPGGVFWWNFYEKPSAEAFFEAALVYLSGGQIDPRRLPSTNVQMQVTGAMLGARRYLFILDGLEVMQHQEGDQYGLLVNADLREFLGYFAASVHDSFCLVTSRAPLLDMLAYVTYTHRDVDRLSPIDGRALLLRLGVKGSDTALDQIVANWDGHALTLSLLGSYLVERYGGDVAHIGDIPLPTTNEPRYERVRRVLRRYDAHLTDTERAFLMLFSAFRLPVAESALTSVFRARGEGGESEEKLSSRGRKRPRRKAVVTGATGVFNAPVAALDDTAFDALLKRLVAYHILSYNPQARHYTTHPIIRAYYFDRFNEHDNVQVQVAHGRIKDYYLSIAGDDTPSNPTLSDLVPLIEAVYHACCAGSYDEALNIFLARIAQGNKSVLWRRLGAFETELALLLDFFPKRDTSQEPQVSTPGDKRYILAEAAFSLLNLGRQSEAVRLYERAIPIALNSEDWRNASVGYRNITDIYEKLGFLTAAADAAREALTLARRAEAKNFEIASLAYQAWIASLLGDLKMAGEVFQQAEALEREMTPQVHYLYSHRGSHHADHLRRIGEAYYARRVTQANLEEWVSISKALIDESRCHRVLGDLDADAGERESARQHYDEALRIARSTARWVLIEALLARGRFTARCGEVEAARSYLDEALGYALAGGYRLYQVDISIAQAWMYLAAGDAALARAQAERARLQSTEMGYYWGQVDADEVLAALGKASP